MMNSSQVGIHLHVCASQIGRWKRDLLCVKSGSHDYCITGEIDDLALRQYQTSHQSPSKPFKPVPDGFNLDMAHTRKALPKGEQA